MLAIAFSLFFVAWSADVRTVLKDRCAKCHGAGTTLSAFDLTTAEGLRKGGKLGPAVVPGDPERSRLYQYVSEGRMPPGEKLGEAEVGAIAEWIRSGADWQGIETKKKWWAFEKPVKAQGSIDDFLKAKLAEKGLTFNPQADHRTLIRRLSFDFTGLPPADEDYALSYDQAVEKYLASPRYGERWARYWLDVVRFGETDGGEHNFERFHAWPYRDYVIEAFNSDKPYREFIREQIAGDILRPNDPKAVAATGFLVAGPWDQVSAVLNKDATLKLQARMDELDDMVTTVAHSFLGLTVNCARCHDHKFDPIPTRDYYRMTAFFSSVGFGEREVASQEEVRRRDEVVKPLLKDLNAVKRKLADVEDPWKAKVLSARYREFDRQREADPKRIPLNPIWNRNSFDPVTARHFRFVITNQNGKAPRLDWLSVGGRTAALQDGDTVRVEFEQPVTVREIQFASDPARGEREGSVKVYRFEASLDGAQWRTICTSIDHWPNSELDLPVVTDEELDAALGSPRRALLDEMERIQKRIDAAPPVTKLYAAKPREFMKSFVLERGNVKRQKEEVAPGVLSAIGGELRGTEPRLALADWVADARNPLTARVIVNRVWYQHFGSGIVNTPSDFGINGDRPSHPELLDNLAVGFMENGWSLKWLHRQIVKSEAYQQSSAMNDKAFAIDAGNRLVWRMPLKRMDAEMLRDSILFVTGKLNLQTGGPSFFLQKKGSRGSYIYKALENDGPEVWRRAIYRFVVRGGERIMLDSFDCPDPSVATPQRAVSNTPVQALTLLNNEFVIRQAGFLAERLQGSPRQKITHAYRLLYGREPRESEMARDLVFLEKQNVATYARALLNSNEFVYVP